MIPVDMIVRRWTKRGYFWFVSKREQLTTASLKVYSERMRLSYRRVCFISHDSDDIIYPFQPPACVHACVYLGDGNLVLSSRR